MRLLHARPDHERDRHAPVKGRPGDDPERIRECLSGNSAAARAYPGIVDAVLEAQAG